MLYLVYDIQWKIAERKFQFLYIQLKICSLVSWDFDTMKASRFAFISIVCQTLKIYLIWKKRERDKGNITPKTF